MNLAHRYLCSSKTWKTTVETHVIPWVLEGLELGANVLEVGPGPGVTTELLHARFERLTCVEIDRGFARSLSKRMSGKNVTVVREDATAMGFPDASFDVLLCALGLMYMPEPEQAVREMRARGRRTIGNRKVQRAERIGVVAGFGCDRGRAWRRGRRGGVRCRPCDRLPGRRIRRRARSRDQRYG